MKIDANIQLIDLAYSKDIVYSLSLEIREEVDNLKLLASRLSSESLNCLDVKYRGGLIPYYRFMSELERKSQEIYSKGGCLIL